MAIYNGNKLAKKLYVGTKPVRAVYAGSRKVWPSVVRVARGVNYGAWTYADPVRRRTATPWEQDIYCDDSVGDVRYGATSTQEETATTAVDWDGSTYWNGSCGSNYYYVDYKKVRTRYTYNDVTRYSGYYNGDSRSRRIEGSCGWVRDWRVVSDWANNGYTCNAAGTRGAYDCSGTYCVRYNQQQRTLSYCFPDKSGSTQTKVEYRAGSENSRAQEDGKCGYTNNHNELRPSTWDWYAGNSLVQANESSYRETDGTLIIEASVQDRGDDARLLFPTLERVTVNSNGTVISSETVDARDLTLDSSDSRAGNFDIQLYNVSGTSIFIGFRKDDYNQPAGFEGTIMLYDDRSDAKIKIILDLTLE